jgi:large subunit ribosomal protein L5
MPATAQTARLKTRYLEEIRPELMSRFDYSSVMQAPKVEKITVNMGVGSAKQDSKALKAATDQLATIAGQRPSVRRARKSIAAFKLREGMPVGLAVTLRAERSYEFLDRLISIAIPRIRDFRGLNPRSFDGRGNYSIGVKEQIIFPEIDYDSIDEVRGLDITITTSARSDVEAFALLYALGMPFAAQGRPKGFEAEGAGSAPAAGAAASEPAPSPQSEPAAGAEDAVAAEAEARDDGHEPSAEAEPAAEAAADAEIETPAEPEGETEASAEATADASTDAEPAASTDAEPAASTDAEPEASADADAAPEAEDAVAEENNDKEGGD